MAKTTVHVKIEESRLEDLRLILATRTKTSPGHKPPTATDLIREAVDEYVRKYKAPTSH